MPPFHKITLPTSSRIERNRSCLFSSGLALVGEAQGRRARDRREATGEQEEAEAAAASCAEEPKRREEAAATKYDGVRRADDVAATLTAEEAHANNKEAPRTAEEMMDTESKAAAESSKSKAEQGMNEYLASFSPSLSFSPPL